MNRLVIAILLACGLNWAAPTNTLEDLPSTPGSHIAKIQAMGDNTWLDLGAPQADPIWGRARGRAYSPKMAYLPDRRAGMLCATGVHGYVKPDGHYMDDLWAYDINGHKWICLYPGAGTPSATQPLDLHLDSNGFEINDRGEHIPVSYLSHGYCNVTYNTDQKLYMVSWRNCPWWCNALPQRRRWLPVDTSGTCLGGQVGPVLSSMKYPLFFNVQTGLWDRWFVEGTGPTGSNMIVLEYLPTIKKTFLKNGQGKIWLFDYPANTWTFTNATGQLPVSSKDYDYLGCYDTKRDRVYIANQGDLFYYDVQSNTCARIHAANQPVFPFSGNHLTFTYDSANDIILANVHKEKTGAAAPGMYVYSPAANEWTHAGIMPSLSGCVNAFYDPQLNVHFFFRAGDSQDNGVIMVYRYQKKDSSHTALISRVVQKVKLTANPNPFKHSITLQLSGLAKNCPLKIYIFDITGRLVRQMAQKNNQATWRADKKQPGIYFVKCAFGDGIQTRRILYIK